MKVKNINKLEELAKITKLNYGGICDNRLFYDNEHISVDVGEMTEKEYKTHCKELNNYQIKGEGYDVSAWNDCSNYEYWKKQSKDGDYNYVQVTLYVNDSEKALKNYKQIIKDVDTVFGHFSHLDKFGKY